MTTTTANADLARLSDADLAEERRRTRSRARWAEEAGDWAEADRQWGRNHAAVAEADRRAGGSGLAGW